MNIITGVRIRLKRAGDVIPKVLGLAEQLTETPESNDVGGQQSHSLFRMPTTCPACGSEVKVVVPRTRMGGKAKKKAGVKDGREVEDTGSVTDAGEVSTTGEAEGSSVMYRCSGGLACRAQSTERIRYTSTSRC